MTVAYLFFKDDLVIEVTTDMNWPSAFEGTFYAYSIWADFWFWSTSSLGPIVCKDEEVPAIYRTKLLLLIQGLP